MKTENIMEVRVAIDHVWKSSRGLEWAFFYLDGVPYIANEDDAR